MRRLHTLISDTESLILFGLVVLVTIIVAQIVKKLFLRKLDRKNKDLKVDVTNFLFIKHLVSITIYLFGIGWALLMLPITKSFAHSFLFGAGATTLFLGLASQQILNNLISGIYIIINKLVKINDEIEISGIKGTVIEISWHDTIILSDKNERVIVPNSVITNNPLRVIIRKNNSA